MHIKTIANKLGVIEVKEKLTEVIIKFSNKEYINQNLVKAIMSKYNKNVMFKLGDEPSLGYNIRKVKKEELISEIRGFLEYLQSVVKN